VTLIAGELYRGGKTFEIEPNKSSHIQRAKLCLRRAATGIKSVDNVLTSALNA
jgi:hypothetical protein